MNKPPKQVKLQYVITKCYDILLDESKIETFKWRLEANELTVMDTKESELIFYESDIMVENQVKPI